MCEEHFYLLPAFLGCRVELGFCALAGEVSDDFVFFARDATRGGVWAALCF